MTSVSGLSREHRIRARDRTCQAALLALNHKDQIWYTQGGQRWDGIRQHKNARQGQFANHYDCSSFATWCLWNGLVVSGFTEHDTVNGTHWTAGYTGTMLTHGKAVTRLASVQRGDCIIYGNGAPGHHTAICVGWRNGVPWVVSMGSNAGPLYLPYNYRRDIMGWRRYI